MPVAPFPIDPVRTRIAVLYRNQAYIADEVLPRVPVGKQEFTYNAYPIEESFALVDTRVGRRSRPNEVTWTATELTARCDDYALDDPIPLADIENQPDGMDVLDRSTEQLADYLAIDREKRVADMVCDPNNYPTGFKVTLSGTSQWSDRTNSNPIGDIVAGMNAALMRPNIMVMGIDVWSVFSTHPQIVTAIRGTNVSAGIVSEDEVARRFGLEAVYVGQSRLNTAKKGQTATLANIWGKHCALLYRNRLATTQRGITFGLTAQFGQRVAGQIQDNNIGMRGGVRNRVGESVKEVIIANRCGYLISNAVA